MGQGSFIELLILGMVAVFLVLRLRSVLGRRTGEERPRPNPFAGGPAQPGIVTGRDLTDGRDNVVRMPARRDRDAGDARTGEPRSLAESLAAIAAADPSFDEKTFLNGAKAAFGMIVEAYARGDLDTLRPLLSDEVFANFSDAVAARKQAGETLETRIERMSDADIVEADLDGSTAVVTVRFATEQTNVTRDAAGTVLDGDPAKPEEVVDLWSFARNTRSRDPNWTLIETRVPA